MRYRMRPYRFSSTFARRRCGCVDALVSLQGGSLGEVFATDVTAVGLVARVAHTVTQQALRVGKGLWAHLHDNKSQD